VLARFFYNSSCQVLFFFFKLKQLNMPKYSEGAGKKVERAMHEKKEGTLKSGKSGKKVTSRKQAIAIGLSEARKAGKKVPKKKSSGSRTKSSRSKAKSA
jgi:hypothetical protein